MTIRIYADFNDQDEDGRVLLSVGDSLRDLERAKDCLRPGLQVTLYTDPNDYVEVPGVLLFDNEHQIWLADWSETRDAASVNDALESVVSGRSQY